MKDAIFVGILFIIATAIGIAGGPRVSPAPLPLENTGANASLNLRNKQGALMFYNFRAVESNALYRGSGFIRDRRSITGGPGVKGPAPFADSLLFLLMKSKNIRTIVCLEEPEYFQAEKRYFDLWSNTPMNKSGYKIEVVNFPVVKGHAYDSDTRSLAAAGLGDSTRIGLRAASKFIQLMKSSKPQDGPAEAGAVYVHCDSGKDSTGVVIAAYELWRNQGRVEKDRLWQQVMDRYRVSNEVIARDVWAGRFAGGYNSCGPDEPAGFVCGSWLEGIRPHLETVAQVN